VLAQVFNRSFDRAWHSATHPCGASTTSRISAAKFAALELPASGWGRKAGPWCGRRSSSLIVSGFRWVMVISGAACAGGGGQRVGADR